MQITKQLVQQFLARAGYYRGKIDGDIGPGSRKAMLDFLSVTNGVPETADAWSENRQMVAVVQASLILMGFRPGPVDGLLGTETHDALEDFGEFQRTGKMPGPWRDAAEKKPPLIATPAKATVFPYQKDVVTYFGAVGTNQTMLELPAGLELRLAWDTKQKVSKFSCHERVADRIKSIFVRAKDHYGDRFSDLGLDLFGGCLNVRKMRGGSAWSMHSWGIAVDIDPARNTLFQTRGAKDTKGRPSAPAMLSRPEYDAWWRIVEDAGAISLGRARNFDYMHWQFARI